jgi:hypothetical protein
MSELPISWTREKKKRIRSKLWFRGFNADLSVVAKYSHCQIQTCCKNTLELSRFEFIVDHAMNPSVFLKSILAC